FIVPNQLTLIVNRRMIFVAEVFLVIFLNPASIGIFLSANIGIVLKTLWRFAFFDLFVLILLVSLAWDVNKAGVDNLSLLGLIALTVELAVKIKEETLY